MNSQHLASAGRPLRMLIVDDNHINLSVLSTLLRRRFSHLLEGSPVTVDSGLKAIQLLRTHVFDCIFMDIQMPFLNGLDATRRIRNAEDGILTANSDAHIVAVTTAVGPEPEMAYRRAGMDGMIGKPVRFQLLQEYLCPLAHQAQISAKSIKPINIDGMQVMPPLPPASKYQRVFFSPVDATVPASTPDICKRVDFEKLLDGQTRASLLQRGDTVSTRIGKSNANSPNPQTQDDICTHFASDVSHSVSHVVTSRSNSSSSLEVIDGPMVYQTRPSSTIAASHPTSLANPGHLRNASMTISQKTLDKQIAREVANADLQSEDTFNNHMSPRSIRRVQSRPHVTHRTSSPGWLLSEELMKFKSSTMSSAAALSKEVPVIASRPKLSVLCDSEDKQPSSSSSFSTPSIDYQSTPSLRRESQVSSDSTESGSSSNVTTPSVNEASSFYWSGQSEHVMKSFNKEHQRLSSGSTVNPFGSSSSEDYSTEVDTTWNDSNDEICPSSSSCKGIVWPQAVPIDNEVKVSAPLEVSPLQQVRDQDQLHGYQYDPSEDLRKLSVG